MKSKRYVLITGLISIIMIISSCRLNELTQKSENKSMPASFPLAKDSLSSAKVNWKEFFKDPYLEALIDTALRNNQELNIVTQEIYMARNEVRARKGAYLPFLNIGAGAGADKSGRYTRSGALENSTEVAPGKKFPDPVPDLMVTADVAWEADVWRKLRNARSAAVHKYLASVEGRNFMVTRLISEIANSYYELQALDNQLEILYRNIEIQQNALEIVKLEKSAAKVTELAVRKFEAEVLKNQSRVYYIKQQITETENRINFLVGRFPQPIPRNSKAFSGLPTDSIQAGVPSHLLANRPDIRQAEQELVSARFDVKSARAEFYPSFLITAGAGFQAFNPGYLIRTPESVVYSLAGGLIAPLVNRTAIKARYYTATSRQIQAAWGYEQKILSAYIEVVNQLSNMNNLEESYKLKQLQVQALTQSIDISTVLFRSARADYMEVLMTQRDALESRFELVEIKKQQMNARVNIYRALGGGWN